MTKRVLLCEDQSFDDTYAFLTSLVVPRPIAWVSTRSATGVANLAPHSFFTVASVAPPVVAITSQGPKDTLANVRQHPEFVVSLVTAHNWEAANATSAPFPAEVDEFAQVGVPWEASDLVDVPRPSGSPAHLECRVRDIIEVGSGRIILGDVVAFVVDEAALSGHPRPWVQALDPVAKLGGEEWTALGKVFAKARPTYQP